MDSAVEFDSYSSCSLNDMKSGDNITFRIDDHTRARGALLSKPLNLGVVVIFGAFITHSSIARYFYVNDGWKDPGSYLFKRSAQPLQRIR